MESKYRGKFFKGHFLCIFLNGFGGDGLLAGKKQSGHCIIKISSIKN
jgi:hypothetical protein